MELFMTEILNVSTRYWIQHLNNWKGLGLIWPEQQQKYVFKPLEFVDRFNLETQNPMRDTNIPSVSAGLAGVCTF